MTEGCGRVTDRHKVCNVCRYRANKDKAFATEGCKRKPGCHERCIVCRHPAHARRCSRCDMEAWHTRGTMCCYMCKSWHNLGKGRDIKISFTKFEFLRLLHEAGKCPDTGHIFDDCSPDRMMRKSPDRIDNAKGYEPGNVRVTTWRANCDRGNTPLDQWLPKVAERYKLCTSA
ncbi:hypothetical protein T492DRAFT_853500 [Pavlovales sp. CCMP2436]|nr:hypothetical protein T492DRAFT_853500 [Pavlovales sp. CCMP2436]